MMLRSFVAVLAGLTVTGICAEPTQPAKKVRINLDELPSVPASPRPAPAKAPASTPAPARKIEVPKAPAAAKSEPRIEGIEIVRPEQRGFLGVALEDHTLKVTFYDADKKPVPADVARIAVRWPVQYQKAIERTLLTPTPDGLAMTSPKVVRAPYNFRLFLTLLNTASDGSDVVVENHSIDFVW